MLCVSPLMGKIHRIQPPLGYAALEHTGLPPDLITLRDFSLL